MRRMVAVMMGWALAGLAAGAARADSFGPDDVCAVPVVDDPRMAPDGSAVVFVLRTCDLATNQSTSDLWYVSTAPGSSPTRLTTDPAADWAPRWSPDGASLAFVSTRSGEPQIWRFDGFFGEPRQVTRQEGGAGGPVWTPDGGQILYTSRGAPVPVDELAGEDVAVHRDLLYRKGPHREQGRFQHVYRVPAAGGEGVRVTYGDHDFSSPAVSPDGRRVAVVRDAEHTGGVYSIDTDVYTVALAGGTLRRITDNPGPDSEPSWSPDGASVLTRSILEEGYESGRRRLLLWPAAGGEAGGGPGAPVELTQGLDRHAFGPRFSGDGRHVEFLVDGPGTWHLARIAVDRPGVLEQLTSGRAWVWGHSSSADGRLTVIERTDASHPGELWLLRRGEGGAVPEGGLALDAGASGSLQPLTSFGEELVARTRPSQPTTAWIDAPSGRRIQVWLYPPTSGVQGPRTPLVVWLHGGPQWCAGERWDPEIQALAGAGFAVLAVNFTGSMGYGQEFMDAIVGDWGGAPYEDAMAAVEWAVAEGHAASHRLGITGGSYGGFLAAYAIGQDHRFAAAVVCRAVIDQVAEYGTTDEQFFDEHDIPGTPWSNPEGYRRWSPLTYADRVTTPTMIIHSDEDRRVPVGQAEAYFTALLRHGVAAELVRFPGEGHGLSRRGTPVHRRERLSHMIRWFQTHIR